MRVKFAHLSDVHLGAWRNDNLNQVGYKVFNKAIETFIEEKVDFVVISGDLYDISNPKVDVVDLATKNFKKLADHGIPIYGIMGSHDFSPSDKSMIRPLISAGLFQDVSKGKISDDGKKLLLEFVEDEKTNIKLTGLRARKRSLEIEDYHMLDLKSLEDEPGIKIFILHTMLSELKPKEYKDMQSAPKSLLPQNFEYYAGGHLHITMPKALREEGSLILNDKNKIVYPGCLFPTDFRELEKLQYGGFCIVSGELNERKLDLNVRYIPIKCIEVEKVLIDGNRKTIPSLKNLITKVLSSRDVKNKLVTVRIFGLLSEGKTYELKSNDIIQMLKDKGAYEGLINKSALSSTDYESVSVASGASNEDIEKTYIHEHAQKFTSNFISKDKMEEKIHQLLSILGVERESETKVMDYNDNLKQSFLNIFDIEDEEVEL
jgi:DNA repair exonuclease SbcCD nuclease subunit